MEVYIKNEEGEYAEATKDDIEALFRERSDKIVSKKLAAAKEKQTEEIRAEIVAKVQTEERDKLKSDLRGEIESEFKEKLDKAEARSNELGIQLRRKTIAAEYGFKPELEKYLGNGTDEEMRKEADTLKNSFATDTQFKAPEKSSDTTEGSHFVKLTKE